MKRYSKVIALLVVLAVICVAIYFVNRHEEKKEEIENTDEIILQIDSDDVTALSWETEDTSFAFHKDETWLYDEDESFPVNQEKIAELLSSFAEMTAAFTISDVEDFDQYGLEEPTCTISFTAGGTEYEVNLGDYSTMDEERYASLGDGKVYLLSADPVDTFSVELSALIQNDDVPVLSEVSSMQFAGAAEYRIYGSETNDVTYSDEDKYFTDAENETIAMDTDLVDGYLGSMETLSLENYVTYNVSDDELTQYGLDDPELTVTVEYTEAEAADEDAEDASEDTEDSDTTSGETQTFVLSVSRSAEDKAAGDATTEDTEETTEEESSEDTDTTEEEDTAYAYVRIGESQIIYSITEDEYQSLMQADVSDLRHQELVWADTDDIYQMEVTIDGTDYLLKSEQASSETEADADGTASTTETATTEADTEDADSSSEDKEEEITWYFGTEEADMTSVWSALSSLAVEEFSSDTSSDKEECSITLHINNANVSEVSLVFYRYDGTTCLAEVNGESFAYVSRSSVVDLLEALNAIVLN